MVEHGVASPFSREKFRIRDSTRKFPNPGARVDLNYMHRSLTPFTAITRPLHSPFVRSFVGSCFAPGSTGCMFAPMVVSVFGWPRDGGGQSRPGGLVGCVWFLSVRCADSRLVSSSKTLGERPDTVMTQPGN